MNTPFPYITNYAATVNYTISPTTFLEGTYGFIRNELTGGNEGGLLVAETANRLTRCRSFPFLPECGQGEERRLLRQRSAGLREPGVLGCAEPNDEPATDLRLGKQDRRGAAQPALPGLVLNINRTQDVAVSVTKVAGRHTMKAGFYNNHSFKAQNVDAGGGIKLAG